MKHLSSRAPWARIFSLAVCALALAGCGGGGSSGGGGGSSLTGAGAGARSISSSPAAIAALSAPSGGYRLTPTARTNQAVAIQSSNSVPNTARASASVVNGALGDNFEISGGDYLSGTGGAVRTFQLGAARTGARSGFLYRNAGQEVTLSDTDDGRDGMLYATVSAASTSAPEDGEYLASSVWVYVPPPAESGLSGSTHEGGAPHPTWEVGALIDAPNGFRTTAGEIASADPTVTYVGEAGGVYVENDGGTTTSGSFTADVDLEATFGSTDKICGELSNFRLSGSSYDATVTLGDADITGGVGGRFNGATSATDSGNAFSGAWGGEFFGDDAEYLCGVFSASANRADDDQTDDNELYQATLVGVFAARDEDDVPVPVAPDPVSPGDLTLSNSEFAAAIAAAQATPTGGAGGVSQAVGGRVTATAVADGSNTQVTVNLPSAFGGALTGTADASNRGTGHVEIVAPVSGVAPFSHLWELERESGSQETEADVVVSHTDYELAGGWEYEDEDNSRYAFGAFAHVPGVSLTPTSFFATPAILTYSGSAAATAIVSSVESDVTAGVSLTATLSPTTNSIEGSMSLDFPGISGGPVLLDLQDATIDTTTAGGFFSGNTRATRVINPSTTQTYTGRWGGQFYGSAADAVAGTFGAQSAADAAFVGGAFVADKQ